MPPLAAILGLQGLSLWAQFAAAGVGTAALLSTLYAAYHGLETIMASSPVMLQRAFALSGLQTALAMMAAAIVAGFAVSGTKRILSLAGRLGGWRK